MTRKEAQAFINTIVAMRDGADDALASRVVELYPTLKEDGSLIKAGTRIHWNDGIKRATTDLWDTADNNPDKYYARMSLWKIVDDDYDDSI